ncbi:MAG: glycosyltransferase [Candidatus Pacebacteria bacterium]|nr:glycosyltransferase [Candidatus Paceibacterota bacterium]
MTFATILGLSSFALWLVLLLYRGRYWEDAFRFYRQPNPLRPKPDRVGVKSPEPLMASSVIPPRPEVIIVIPILNRARAIRRVLLSLLHQDYSNLTHIILVDQQSTDSSLDIAATVPPMAGRTLHLLPHSPLPPEWSSRTWALSQGLLLAKSLSPTAELVWFADPETIQGEAMLSSLVASLESEGRDMISIMPELPVGSFIERIAVPAYHYFFSLLNPFSWVNDPLSSAAAAGSSTLLRRAALERIGGIITIVGIDEDASLAAAIKGIGTIKIENSDQAVSLRRYLEINEVRKLLARVVPAQQKNSIFTHTVFISGLLVGFILPPMLALFSTGVAQFFGYATWLMMTLSLMPTIFYCRLSPFWGLMMPLSACLYIWAVAESLVLSLLRPIDYATSELREHRGKNKPSVRTRRPATAPQVKRDIPPLSHLMR